MATATPAACSVQDVACSFMLHACTCAVVCCMRSDTLACRGWRGCRCDIRTHLLHVVGRQPFQRVLEERHVAERQQRLWPLHRDGPEPLWAVTGQAVERGVADNSRRAGSRRGLSAADRHTATETGREAHRLYKCPEYASLQRIARSSSPPGLASSGIAPAHLGDACLPHPPALLPAQRLAPASGWA